MLFACVTCCSHNVKCHGKRGILLDLEILFNNSAISQQHIAPRSNMLFPTITRPYITLHHLKVIVLEEAGVAQYNEPTPGVRPPFIKLT